jgi:hypothetical protein
MHDKPHIRLQPFSGCWECSKMFAPTNPFHEGYWYGVQGVGHTPAQAYWAYLHGYHRTLAAGRITEAFDARNIHGYAPRLIL